MKASGSARIRRDKGWIDRAGLRRHGGADKRFQWTRWWGGHSVRHGVLVLVCAGDGLLGARDGWFGRGGRERPPLQPLRLDFLSHGAAQGVSGQCAQQRTQNGTALESVVACEKAKNGPPDCAPDDHADPRFLLVRVTSAVVASRGSLAQLGARIELPSR